VRHAIWFRGWVTVLGAFSALVLKCACLRQNLCAELKQGTTEGACLSPVKAHTNTRRIVSSKWSSKDILPGLPLRPHTTPVHLPSPASGRARCWCWCWCWPWSWTRGDINQSK
jgi:hypothetical protein